MLKKFKIGDRVRCIHARDDNFSIVGRIGTIRVIERGRLPIGVEFDEAITDGHDLQGYIRSGRGFWVEVEDCKLINDEKIVIYRKDNEVIAKDCITGKTAVAKCDPRDEFKFETGAKLALERLYENVTFTMLCVKDYAGVLTRGKIYEAIDGAITYDDGNKGFKYDSFKDYASRNPDYRRRIVELKDGDDVNEILKQYGPIKKGDKVTVIDIGNVYPRNDTWKGLKGYESHYVVGKDPIENKVYTVLNVKKHNFRNTNLALIQDKDTTQVFIIDVDGLKKEV